MDLYGKTHVWLLKCQFRCDRYNNDLYSVKYSYMYFLGTELITRAGLCGAAVNVHSRSIWTDRRKKGVILIIQMSIH